MRFRWLLVAVMMGFSGWLMAGYVTNEVSYYEPDGVRQGDSGYLEERCKLDIYHPEGETGLPVVIWLHGGGLVGGAKFIPEVLKNSGLVVVAPNYRLSGPRATTKDALADTAAATAWVFRHIAEYGGDPAEIYISGGSGGGYLAAMIGMNPAYLAAYGLDCRKLAGIMPISGQMTTHMQVLNEKRGTTGLAQPMQQAIDEYAPLYYVSADLAPITLYVGDPDIEWPARVEENAMLAAMLKRVAHHPDVEFVSLKGFDHGDVYDPAMLLMKKKIAANRLKMLRARVVPLSMRVSGEAEKSALTDRTGKPFAPATEVTLRKVGDDLVIHFDCSEPASEAGTDSTDIFGGECVEVFLAPDPANPAKAGQWGIGRDGRVAYMNLGAPEALAAGVTTQVETHGGGWSATLTLPVRNLPDPARLRANFFRHRKTAAMDAYANWSPTLAPLNYIPEAFGTVTVE